MANTAAKAYPSKPRLSNGEKLKLIFKLLTICKYPRKKLRVSTS